ncbi:MAG: TadE family protein [Planctomycetaceae bacterium]|nr:TadE family protein [Planctomycetaceae bacterium]
MNNSLGKVSPVNGSLRPRRQPVDHRRGSAAVECAVVMPVLVALVMGLIQSGFSVDATHKLYASIRQAGRLASMDYKDLLQPGQTGNQKVIQDIKNTLAAEGLPVDQLTVTITHAETGGAFNLDDAANNLELFKIHVEVPFATVADTSLLPAPVETLSASIVFRKGKNTLAN